MRSLSAVSAAAFAFGALAFAGTAGAAQIDRIQTPGPGIAQGAIVPAGSETFYVSGITPTATNPGATPAVYGDTHTQTLSVLKRIEDILKSKGYGFGDVVMMRVLLVGDKDKGGAMDFAGMNSAYQQFFGTAAQPNKPARITSQVVALANPAFLVEIEVQAAKAK